MSNNTELATVVVAELAKTFLMMYFIKAREAGMTSAQADALYQSEKAKFIRKDPNLIPGA